MFLNADPAEVLQRLMNTRHPLYAEADITLPCNDRPRFIEVDPPTQLVWANGFADAEGALVPAPFPGLEAFPLENLNTLTLEAAGPGQTRLRLRSTPLSDDPAAHAAFAGLLPSMEGGFGGTLTSLEEFLAHGT
jgi:hypothetical protein